MLKFNVRYLEEGYELKHTGGYEKSDYIDLYCVEADVIHIDGTSDKYKGDFESFNYKAGDIVFINFGVAIDLTDTEYGVDYTANVLPRSSLFKKHGLILSNSVGVIDNAYKGDSDWWLGMFIAVRDGKLSKLDRVAQFTVTEKSPKLVFNRVDKLGNEDRNGFGSTGRN